VTVAGRAREYRDADRDCQRRARLAAVFSALVLAPEADGADESETSTNASAEPAPPPAPAAPPPAAIVATPPPPDAAPPAERYAITVAPAVALAPHRGSALAAAGLALGASRLFGSSNVAIALAVPILPADLTVGGAAVRLDRYPLRLLAGRGVQRGSLRVAVQAGAVAALLRVQRVSPAPTSSTTRIEAGGHIGLGAALAVGRVGLYLSVSTDWIPRTYPIALDPEGTVDRTPAFWLAGEAGLRFAFH
jgi:hypothetical protein